MSPANYPANIGQVNAQLGREVTRAMAKARMTVPALVKATGLGESWVKQVKTGRIDRPDPDKLVRMAEELGADPARWLALSNQLGASVPTSRSTPDHVAAALDRHATALQLQAKAYVLLAQSIDNAAKGVLEKVAGFDQTLTELMELAGRNRAPATDGDGEPAVPAQQS